MSPALAGRMIVPRPSPAPYAGRSSLGFCRSSPILLYDFLSHERLSTLTLYAILSLNFHFLPKMRNIGRKTQFILDNLFKFKGHFFFTVNNENFRFIRECAEPL